jgi:hypothetical protein
MSGKNKGGREVRKPKQDKKAKAVDTVVVAPRPGAAKKAR